VACTVPYVMGIAWAVCPHLVPNGWYVLFYYDAPSYGTACADFGKYSTDVSSAREQCSSQQNCRAVLSISLTPTWLRLDRRSFCTRLSLAC
jgi:hypothetical protein